MGFEPITSCVSDKCSTDWATRQFVLHHLAPSHITDQCNRVGIEPIKTIINKSALVVGVEPTIFCLTGSSLYHLSFTRKFRGQGGIRTHVISIYFIQRLTANS